MALSPKVKSLGGFFEASDEHGRQVNVWLLTTSIFISWIFAKSITNAANLGEKYGFVGGVGYACYWLCIPVAGVILYRLRGNLCNLLLLLFFKLKLWQTCYILLLVSRY